LIERRSVRRVLGTLLSLLVMAATLLSGRPAQAQVTSPKIALDLRSVLTASLTPR
jgi:hypothetical protein